MSTGKERAAARELQAIAKRSPLALAPQGGPADPRFFRQVDREMTWGLTLNK
jgi:hypothetical protein